MPNPALPAVIDHIRRLTRTPAGEGLTDRQLLQRFAAGRDEVAFAALVRRQELRRLLGHEGQVGDVAVSPDGKTAVPAGAAWPSPPMARPSPAAPSGDRARGQWERGMAAIPLPG